MSLTCRQQVISLQSDEEKDIIDNVTNILEWIELWYQYAGEDDDDEDAAGSRNNGADQSDDE